MVLLGGLSAKNKQTAHNARLHIQISVTVGVRGSEIHAAAALARVAECAPAGHSACYYYT